jgi:hypothetical protein
MSDDDLQTKQRQARGGGGAADLRGEKDAAGEDGGGGSRGVSAVWAGVEAGEVKRPDEFPRLAVALVLKSQPGSSHSCEQSRAQVMLPRGLAWSNQVLASIPPSLIRPRCNRPRLHPWPWRSSGSRTIRGRVKLPLDPCSPQSTSEHHTVAREGNSSPPGPLQRPGGERKKNAASVGVQRLVRPANPRPIGICGIYLFLFFSRSIL